MFYLELVIFMKDKTSESLRILGIDPGLNVTGYGIIDSIGDDVSLVEGGVINISSGYPLEKRLSTIFYGIQEVISEFKPDVIALEEVYTHYERPRVAVMMGHARGVICLAAAVNHVPISSYAPTHIKSSLTGNGRASKEQIRRMVITRLNLKSAPDTLDVTDALAAALCHVVRGEREADYLRLAGK
jgi:crossover junction endodeoxyribonuclease RuvC